MQPQWGGGDWRVRGWGKRERAREPCRRGGEDDDVESSGGEGEIEDGTLS